MLFIVLFRRIAQIPKCPFPEGMSVYEWDCPYIPGPRKSN